MKIIYSGGYDKYIMDSVAKSPFYRYSDVVSEQIRKGKVVASINFAKPDSYYDSRLDEIFGGKVISIDKRNKDKVNWDEYDIIFMPGGNQKWLKEGLLETEFSLYKLKETVVIIGDSAGAYVMGKYFPAYDGEVENINDRNIQEFVEEGLFPESNVLVIAHINNKRYVPDKALELAKKLADKLDVRLLALEENEEKLFDRNNEFVKFDINTLFE